jgi:methionine sulfoxide reductase heme-binding subunit
MYRLVPLHAAAAPRPRRKNIILGFIAVLGFTLLGAVSLGAIAYYLPATAAHAYWFISRSSGVVAYVLITLSVIWGLVQSGSLLSPRTLPGLPFGLHSFLSWLGLGVAALHGLVLLGDRYINFDLAQLVAPFISTYRPIPTGLGVVSFYLMLLLTLSFYARPHLSQKNFRLLHYASFGAFALVTLHGIFAGTDSPALWWLYAASLLSVVLLTVLRVVNTRRRATRQPLRPELQST